MSNRKTIMLTAAGFNYAVEKMRGVDTLNGFHTLTIPQAINPTAVIANVNFARFTFTPVGVIGLQGDYIITWRYKGPLILLDGFKDLWVYDYNKSTWDLGREAEPVKG